MNHRLPWACIHQLTLINKMHDVLFTGSPHSQACFCCPTLDGGQRMEVGPTKQARVCMAPRRGWPGGIWGGGCEHLTTLICCGLSF